MDGASTRLQTLDDAFSYIHPIGYSVSTRCGYCGRGGKSQSQSKRYSYYASTTSMTTSFYQTLVDRCWRRSGSLLYRPNQRSSCCPHYTIRLDSSLFKPSRDQRQAVNRFNKFVIGDDYAREAARKYPRSREETRKRDTEFDLTERIHECEADLLKTPLQPAHHFTVTLEDDNFTEEKYRVFENYQRVIHREGPDDISREGFRRFLCDSPLGREAVDLPDGRKKQLGSFHQMYRLDGELVAIGVLDLLPHSVSAVYFLYHEAIHKFSPGKMGALREIALAREGDYGWWYPGFYIHSCPKMRYKLDYSPQFILDPETLTWDPVGEEVLELLDKYPYVSLSRERRLLSTVGGAAAEEEQPASRTSRTAPARDPITGRELLFQSSMPGLPPLADVFGLNMDHIPVRLKPSGRPQYEISDLVAWGAYDVEDAGGLKGAIAELVAMIGVDLMGELCLDFSRVP